LDRLARELLARGGDPLLHLLGRVDEPLEVRGEAHSVLISRAETPKRCCAFLIMGCWRASDSRFLRSTAIASASTATSERTAGAAAAPTVMTSLVGWP